MSKTTIVGGKIIETTGGDFNIYAKENIVYFAATTITETGVEKGVNFGEPQTYQNTEKPEVAIKVMDTVFLPLGIFSFKGEKENSKIQFEIKCKKGEASGLLFSVKREGSVIFSKNIEETLASGAKTIVEWDGFSDARMYDSTFFVDGSLTAEVSNGEAQASEKIEFKYKEVDWVDLKIDDNEKKAEVTLRVNLKEAEISPTSSKTFDQLVALSIDGLKLYWGRNKTRSVGSSVQINGADYEITVNPINTAEKSMPALNVYSKTENYGRSRNWWASRKLFFNDGYHASIYAQMTAPPAGSPALEDEKEFKHTAAHEIGHEILQEYGGKYEYSYVHKDSSTLLTQSVKPESTLPPTGEIDLMKYYSDDPFFYRDSIDFYNRNVAHEKDVQGLLWCSKLKTR